MYCASLINLSAGGMQVITYDMLKTQKQYDIAIYTPAFRYPISARGRVVWQMPYNGKDTKQYYRIGLEFTYFKGPAMERLEELENRPKLREIRRD
ncbi:MAG: PilZ domain-containing protein [Thermodesulfobacteriota bacterium]|nr:PilZ domain-containing protein [Thermodesulfobacteriota bacterium]